MRIEYGPGFPPEIRSAIDPLLQKWAFLAPTWCTRMLVRFTQDNEAKISITVRESQRDALLWVHPDWIEWSDEREVSVIHEMCHFYNAALENLASDGLKTIFGGDYPTPGSRVLEMALSECLERQNNDLVALILRLTATA